jgi:hypothetical protein
LRKNQLNLLLCDERPCDKSTRDESTEMQR